MLIKLRSGDITNDKYLANLEKNKEKYINMYKDLTLNDIARKLFTEDIDELTFHHASYALSLSDELDYDIFLANVLYFVLAVNLKYPQGKIRSWSQAYLYYESCNGSYLDLTLELEDMQESVEFNIKSKNISNSLHFKISMIKYISGGNYVYSYVGTGQPFIYVSILGTDIKNMRIPLTLFRSKFVSDDKIHFKEPEDIIDIITIDGLGQALDLMAALSCVKVKVYADDNVDFVENTTVEHGRILVKDTVIKEDGWTQTVKGALFMHDNYIAVYSGGLLILYTGE